MSPLVDALAVLELRLRSLPLAAFVERAAFLYAPVKGRHLIPLQASQVMPAGGDPDADDIEDIVGDYGLDGLLRSALQLERGDAPITGECRWYSIITACTPPLAVWESTDPPWPIRETAAPLDTARDALMFSTLRRFCGHIDAAAADESTPPLQAIAPSSDIEEARASMSETGAQERASAAMRDAEADYAESAEPSCDELRRAAIADEGPAAEEARRADGQGVRGVGHCATSATAAHWIGKSRNSRQMSGDLKGGKEPVGFEAATEISAALF